VAKRIGQPFVAITDGDMAVLRRLGRNAPRAVWLLTILRRQAGAKKMIEISDGQLARLGRVSTSTVYHGVRDLIELNFIRKASGDRVGRRSVKNAYQILPSPIIRDELDKSSEIEDRFSQIEGPVLESRGIVPRKSRDKRPKTENPLIDNRDIDILDGEKKNGKGFCLREDEVNIGGVDEISGDSVAEMEELLWRIGFRRGMNEYAHEIVDNGFTLQNIKDAAKIACYKVAKGETQISKQLGGIVGQGGWTSQLQQESVKYMRGVVSQCIRKGMSIKIPEWMLADMSDDSKWMNTMIYK
jgi:hypothetical protein